MFKLNKKIIIGLFSLFLILGIGVALQARAQLTAPTLLSPANGATVSSLATTLSWSSVSGATFYELKIKKSTDADYVYYYYISATSKTLTLTDNTTYNWAVHACETEFTGCSAWSSGLSFTVQTTPTPSLTFLASPNQVSSGGSTTLTWSSTNATSCSAGAYPANSQWTGSKASSGSQSITNLTAITVFSLTCTGAGGSATKTATVNISAASVPTLTFSASPTSISSGGSTSLAWSSANATSCSAIASPSNSQWSGSKVTSGSQVITNLTTNTTFTLTCTGAGGSVTQSVTVTVQPPTILPALVLIPSSGSVIQGGSVSFAAYINDFYQNNQIFSYSNLPAGVTLTFSSSSCVPFYHTTPQVVGSTTIPEPNCSISANFSTSSATPTGSYTLAISATGGGTTTTAYFTLTVTAPSPTGQITVLSPNGTELWGPGETHRITWNSSGVNSVQIYIYNPSVSGSGSTNYITPNGLPVSAAFGYYDWTIPSLSQLPGGGGNYYKIRIFDANNPTIEDYSNNYFSIVSAVGITCTDSDGGDQIYTKGAITIRNSKGYQWAYTDYCQDSGSLQEYNCLSNLSGYTDDNAYNAYQLAYHQCPYGCQNGACLSQGLITVTFPSAGAILSQGSTYNITWVGSDPGVSSYSVYLVGGSLGSTGAKYLGIAYASQKSFSWTVPSDITPVSGYQIQLSGAGATGDNSDSFSIAAPSPTPTPTPTTCDATSFASYIAAFDFGTAGGTVSNVCGKEQYYKVTLPAGQTCGIKWTLQPDSNSDYDLYARWGTGTLSRDSYQERSISGKGLKDELSKTSLSAGTYYAMAYKESGTTGSYSITVTLTNCTIPVTPTPTPTPTTLTPEIQAYYQAQITQLLAKIAQLEAELARVLAGQPAWCHTFNANLRYGDSGSEIEALQTALEKQGLYQKGTNPASFEDYLASSVVAFQEKYISEILTPYRLTRGTGFVGPSTRAKLNQLYGCK